MVSTNLLLGGQKFKQIYYSYFKEMIRKHRLTQNEIDVILFLYNNPAYDTAGDIVTLRSLSKSQVSASIESLMQRDFLERFPNPADRRCLHLNITDAGLKVARELKETQQEFLKLLFTGVSDQERNLLDTVLEKMIKNIEGD